MAASQESHQTLGAQSKWRKVLCAVQTFAVVNVVDQRGISIHREVVIVAFNLKLRV